MVLLILGLAISIPLVIFGSTLMIKLMERFPIIVMLGAALIGWVGGETIVQRCCRCTAYWRPIRWLHYAAAAAAGAVPSWWRSADGMQKTRSGGARQRT